MNEEIMKNEKSGEGLELFRRIEGEIRVGTKKRLRVWSTKSSIFVCQNLTGLFVA
jgi:hypothetical protein